MSRVPGFHQACLASHRLYENYLTRSSLLNAGFSFSGKRISFFSKPNQQVLQRQPCEIQWPSKGHSRHQNGLGSRLTTKITGGLLWRPIKSLYDIDHFHCLVFHVFHFCSQLLTIIQSIWYGQNWPDTIQLALRIFLLVVSWSVRCRDIIFWLLMLHDKTSQNVMVQV